jgi:cobalt-zinc-cadmium efflux system protein
MRGAILHVLGDLLGSLAAIVAAVIILTTGWTPIDPILSVLVALLILTTAWRLMREAAHVLLEGVPASLDRDAVARDIEISVKGVREVHHMHVWSLDGSSSMATLHACLEEGVDAHQAVSAIKRRLAAMHGIDHATVEQEFDHCADAEPRHDHSHGHAESSRHYH